MIDAIIKKYALTRQGAKDLVKAIIACAVQNIVLMLPVSLLYFLVSDMLGGSIPQGHLWIYIVGIIGALLLIGISYFFQYNNCFFSTYKESGAKRISLAEKLRKLPLSFFGKKDLSELTSTIMGDSATLETAFSHWLPEFYGSMISTVIIAVSLFFFDWRMAIAALWVLPVSLALVFFSKKAQNYFGRKQFNAKNDAAEGIQECLETVQVLKSENAAEKYLKGLNKKFERVEKTAMGSELGTAIFVISAGVILKLGIATVALVGGTLLLNGTLGVLSFFMFLLVVSRLYDPMQGSLINLAAINGAQMNIDRMSEIDDYPEQSGERKFSSNGYDIEFKNVGFSYNDGEAVLNDVSFTAKQGEVTALIGPSGGGKSTCSKLAARFYDANKGTITIGGTDVKTVNAESLLSAYSIVFQDVTLFNNTIMENIRIGKNGATDEEVLEAAREAQVDEFASKLPNGYNTEIGENGCELSGGERQRISIARAMLKNSPIILLDEATASLDAENETQVQKALSKLIRNKTVLIIAHRMRTVSGADKIVVLKDGVVAETGSPEYLENKNGLYANMVKLQNESQNWRI